MLPMPFQRWTTYPGHDGVDFPQDRNTPILASADGVITQISASARGGWRVWVYYGKRGTLKYAHMDARNKILVNVGDTVKYRQPIALVGSLGVGSTGPHSHIENGAASGFENVWKIVDKNSYVNDGSAVSSDSKPFPKPEEDDMFTDEDRAKLDAVYAALFGARNITGERTPIKWVDIDNVPKQIDYGVLDIIIENQQLIVGNK